MSVFGKIVYGLQVAAIGLVVVFLGLAILIGCVLIMGALFRRATARKDEKAKAAEQAARAAAAAAAKAEPAAPVVPATPEPAPQEGEVDDPQLIAVIAAAIAAFSDANKPLVVRRVRRVSGWNRASRAEQVYRF